jgi:CO/xanthine dehydrogenase FAD-binding subunit
MDNLTGFRYPKSLEEVLALLDEGRGKARVIAGGTSVALGRFSSGEILLDISRVGLDRIFIYISIALFYV